MATARPYPIDCYGVPVPAGWEQALSQFCEGNHQT